MDNPKISIGFESKGYDRADLDFVLDRSFSQFGQQDEDQERTVDQFFVDYENLFYQIPVEGEINSHEYLIRKSSELYHLDASLENIQPLLDEITLLRSQSVAYQQTIVDLQSQLATANITEESTLSQTELTESLDESN